MADRDVMIAFPHPGTVRTEFMTTVRAACNVEGTRIGHIADLQTGPGIGIARNTIAGKFLASDMDWLWMVDTDMVISANTLPALLDAADPVERPVVGAFCCILHEGAIKPTLYGAARDTDGSFGYKHIGDWPHDQLLRVDATGCGCLLIHRSAFERITARNPDEEGVWFAEMILGHHELGEDLAFCTRCSQAEIPVFVHTGIEVGHMKTMQIGKVNP